MEEVRDIPEKVKEAWRHPFLKERVIQRVAYDLVCFVSENNDAGIMVDNVASGLIRYGYDEIFDRLIKPILEDRDTFDRTVIYLVDRFELSPRLATARKEIAEESYKYFLELAKKLEEFRKIKVC